jgi:hypothetical protein
MEHTQGPTWYEYHRSDGGAQVELVRQLCSGQVLTQFNEQLVNLQLAAKLIRATALMNALERDPIDWVKEMDKQDFDQFAREDIQMLISFCKRMESAEDFHNNSNKQGSNSRNSHKKTKFSNNKGKLTKGSGKWCEYHKTNTHDMSECSVLKKMKESGRNNSSDKKPFNKNKTWTKKSNEDKKFSKKELNALVKKASEKAVKKATKELNAVAKRKRSDNDDNDLTSSLHMLENEMKDVNDQLKNFNFAAVDEVEV